MLAVKRSTLFAPVMLSSLLAAAAPVEAAEGEASTAASAGYEHTLEKGPWSVGFGIGGAYFKDWGHETVFGETDLSTGGFALHADAVWGVNESLFWRVKGQFTTPLCIDHQSGTCPHFVEFALTRGHTLRHRWGHVSAEYGLSGGWIDPNVAGYAPHDPGKTAVVGLTTTLEAYITPLPFVGVGLEMPITLNHRLIGGGVMVSFKVGNLAPY